MAPFTYVSTRPMNREARKRMVRVGEQGSGAKEGEDRADAVNSEALETLPHHAVAELNAALKDVSRALSWALEDEDAVNAEALEMLPHHVVAALKEKYGTADASWALSRALQDESDAEEEGTLMSRPCCLIDVQDAIVPPPETSPPETSTAVYSAFQGSKGGNEYVSSSSNNKIRRRQRKTRKEERTSRKEERDRRQPRGSSADGHRRGERHPSPKDASLRAARETRPGGRAETMPPPHDSQAAGREERGGHEQVASSGAASRAAPPLLGTAIFTYPLGGVYEGECLGNKRHGEGKYTSANGNVYEGRWLNDKRHGQGKYTNADGAVYEGGWKEGKRHGQGSYTLADREMYDGQWLDGQRHGQGKCTWANGEVHAGRDGNGGGGRRPRHPTPGRGAEDAPGRGRARTWSPTAATASANEGVLRTPSLFSCGWADCEGLAGIAAFAEDDAYDDDTASTCTDDSSLESDWSIDDETKTSIDPPGKDLTWGQLFGMDGERVLSGSVASPYPSEGSSCSGTIGNHSSDGKEDGTVVEESVANESVEVVHAHSWY